MNKSKLLIPVIYSLAESYKIQLEKYQAMLKLAQKQKQCVENGNITDLERIILARQKLIKELDVMNDKLKPLKQDIIITLGIKDFSSTALLDAIPDQATQDLSDMLVQIGDTLYAIKELDQVNEKLLREKLSQVDTKLNDFQKKDMAQKAYKNKLSKEISSSIDENK